MVTSLKRTLWSPSVIILILTILVLASSAFVSAQGPSQGSREGVKIEAVFSPGGGCESRIVQEIDGADKTIRAQMHMFTSKPIADAFVKAKKRGVDVQLILDKSQEKMAFGRWPVMKRGGVKVLFDRDHDTANNKIVLIDGKTIITGSYNFTKAAEEKNAENVVIIENSPELCEQFLANFDKHRAHSHPGNE